MDGGETQRHRQALTRTAEARLGWTLTREGTVARHTAAASQRRATAQQVTEGPSDGSATYCEAVAQHSPDCPTQRRLCNQWLRRSTALPRRGVLGDAKQGHGYAANGQQGHGRALHSYGLAKMALQRQGKAKRSSAGATQGLATPRFAQRRQRKARRWLRTALLWQQRHSWTQLWHGTPTRPNAAARHGPLCGASARTGIATARSSSVGARQGNAAEKRSFAARGRAKTVDRFELRRHSSDRVATALLSSATA